MGEGWRGKEDFYKLLEGCCETGNSKEKDEAHDAWDDYYGKGSFDFDVYSLLDIRKPGSYIFGPLVFTHSPFYIGHGNGKQRVKKSRDYLQQSGEYNLKVKKMEEIYKETGNSSMRVKIIGKFKTKNKAALVERKIIQLIRDNGHVLDNSDFRLCEVPLKPEDYKLMDHTYMVTT